MNLVSKGVAFAALSLAACLPALAGTPQISSRETHVLSLDAEGTVYAWEDDKSGALGTAAAGR